MKGTTSPTTAIRTRWRPTPAAASMTLRLGRDGGEDGRGGGGFAEARAATAAPAADHEDGEQDRIPFPFLFARFFFFPNLLMGRAALFGGSSTVHWTHARGGSQRMHSMLTVACSTDGLCDLVADPELKSTYEAITISARA